MSSNYGWCIDIAFEKPVTNKFGPWSITSEQIAALKRGEGRQFKMYGDDSEGDDGATDLMYEGRFIGDSDSEDGFGPLDDYGAPDGGAVRIDYLNNHGKWETL